MEFWGGLKRVSQSVSQSVEQSAGLIISMARDTRKTNIGLGIVAAVFIFTIIILCIVPKEGGQRYSIPEQSARGRDHEGITNTTSTSTSTTTSSTTSTSASTPTTATTSSTASAPTSTTSTPTTATTSAPTTATTSTPTTATTSTPTTATTSTASSTSTTATTSSTDSTLTNGTTSSTASSNTTDLSSETSPTTIIEDSTTPYPSSPPETKPTSETTNTTEETTTKNSTDTTITTTTTPSKITPTETTNISEKTITENDNDITTTTDLPHMNNKCELPACVSLASDIRVMMDSAGNVSACEDFYQYACGGVMNKPYIMPMNRGAMARKIIKDELGRQNSSDTNSAGGKMKAFYDSCLSSGSQDTRKSWAELIKNMFDIYQFIDSAMNDTDFNFDLNEALGYMMKRGFTPFFDIELEVDPDGKENFMISLHPTIPGSPFSNNLARKVCLEEHHSNLTALGNTSYNVAEAYDNFTNCVGTGKGLEARLVRMKDAVVQFELTKSEELLEKTLAMTKNFLTELSEHQPPVPDLIMNLANNDYDSIKYVDELHMSIIDWTTVLSVFLNADKSEVNTRRIAIYSERSMNSINEMLNHYHDMSKAELNNILVLLWAEWIYTVLVEPVRGSEQEYCLNTAISLMEDTASYLYLQAVDPDVKARNEQIDKIAANIKQEGLSVLRDWSLPEPFLTKLETMMENVIKLDNVKREIATKSMEEVSLTGDFLHNTLLLVEHQSTLMKNKLDAGTAKMWRVFARPYDPFGIYNYRLNNIMIPYASQEPFQTLRDAPEYLQYARIGHQISHLMWHGYDTSGIGFLPGATSFTDIKLRYNQLKTEYIGAKSYKNPKGLTANYEMTNLTTNEIWADVGAIDLVWQAYLKRNEVKPTAENLVEKQVQNIQTRRRRSVTDPQDFEEQTLPFLDMTPAQLYHLYWAQSYCSDSSDLNMLEVTESRKPPGRERVNFVTQHSEEFKKAFSCTLN
ncbi:hypothetical protein O3P69_014359 [Scylla paramamosain]|uniref:Uncharacterized protein n=1 Tax=Scylla paramamosain TaxID=85552 RepID=A0AAW0TDI3_SCYPA